MIYSIGYQKLTLDELKQILEQYNISLLIDVRSVPYSRKPQFNRKRLEQVFGSDSYVWKGDILGGKYGPATEEGIDFLLQHDKQKNQILMCLETDPRDCHRYQDIGIRLLQRGVEANHIISDIIKKTSEILKQNVY